MTDMLGIGSFTDMCTYDYALYQTKKLLLYDR